MRYINLTDIVRNERKSNLFATWLSDKDKAFDFCTMSMSSLEVERWEASHAYPVTWCLPLHPQWSTDLWVLHQKHGRWCGSGCCGDSGAVFTLKSRMIVGWTSICRWLEQFNANWWIRIVDCWFAPCYCCLTKKIMVWQQSVSQNLSTISSLHLAARIRSGVVIKVSMKWNMKQRLRINF